MRKQFATSEAGVAPAAHPAKESQAEQTGLW